MNDHLDMPSKETTHQPQDTKERILRLSDVKERTGLSRSTIYLYISDGIFPRPINLGARCVGWLESEIDSWIEKCIHKSRI
jgi:prophage regulatory protein